MRVQSESGDPVETYLLRFRLALGKMPETEKGEIVSDIRCHIAERMEDLGGPAGEAAGQTLDALGSPESLAQIYRSEGLLNRAAGGWSPWLLARATFLWALAGIRGFFALVALMTGYAAALSFLACAVLKPIFPGQIGMWVDPPLFTFGLLNSSAHLPPREVLGYWIIPVSLIMGLALLVLTTRLGGWLIRHFAIKPAVALPRQMARTLALLCALAVGVGAQPSSLVGKWSGVLDAGPAKLHVGLDVSRGSEGALKATLSVVEQGVTALPIEGMTLAGDRVSFRVERIGGSYAGTLKGGRMEGAWSQGGHDLPLTFEQGSGETPAMRRPQNPIPPFPYNAAEAAVTNGSVTLAGTFTYPKSGGPFPALLLVTGSGPEDRDETVFGHKPFLVLSDYLTRAGFAVLRLDDRGTGKSTGEFKTAGLDEFTGDALAAVAWLKGRKDVDARKIGILGHSEGGAVGPLAALRSQDIAFLVLMAAPGVAFDRLMYRQEADLMRAQGEPESAIVANRNLVRRVFSILREEPDGAKASQRLNQLMTEIKTESPELAATLKQQAPGMLLPEFRSLLRYNPAETLAKVKCPVLAINGSKDLQVAAEENLPGIVAALTAGHNPDFAVEELPGLNHLFQTAKTGSPAEYAVTEETIAPRALAVVRDWLLAHTH